ncbi:MAG: four helix bundle protein [Cyanobacteriota bacterium]|nr:four helix bundle protein [Cyanobacteriota bacterium]
MTTASRGELPIIQATMDLIQWFVPLLNRLPHDHRFALGDRLVQGLYDLLEGLVAARYATAKLDHLEPLNARLVEDVGRQLGGWISQQQRRSASL